MSPRAEHSADTSPEGAPNGQCHGIDLQVIENRGELLGAFLRNSREEKAIHLTEIARQTKIPIRSLEHLEAGDFDRLPADIFVRGFLRSYADCVGLEEDDVLDRYLELGRKPPALSSDLAGAARTSRRNRDDATLLPAPGARTTDANGKRRRTILPELTDSEREGRRAPVTVAVIILVIVATLAMSYLLRRPSADSDGFTHLDPIELESTSPHGPTSLG